MKSSLWIAAVASCLGTLGTATGCAARRAAPPQLTSAVANVEPQSAAALYAKAVRLEEAGATDEAVRAYELAEETFGRGRPLGTGLAIYGRARALDRAGRCNEAWPVYQQYVSLVASSDPVSAGMAIRVGSRCYESARPDPAVATVSTALVAGEDAKAVEVADAALSEGDTSSWLLYDRGVALAATGRTSDAVDAFRAAERAFGEQNDEANGPLVAGKLLAVYGRARALVDAYRCKEARAAYAQYADMVRATDPGDAQRVREYADDCR